MNVNQICDQGESHGAVLPVAAGEGTPENLQPLCSVEVNLHHTRGVGFKLEMVGAVKGRGFAAPEEKSGGGRGRVRCGVRREQDWWVEGMGPSRHFLHRFEEDHPEFGWGLGCQ